MTLHTRLHTVPFWYLPGMPIPVVPARDGRADMVIIQKLILPRPTGLNTSFVSVPARDESANIAIIPKHTVLYTGLFLHPPGLTVRARDGQAEMTIIPERSSPRPSGLHAGLIWYVPGMVSANVPVRAMPAATFRNRVGNSNTLTGRV